MSLLQYLNTKFPLEYNYLGAHGLLPFSTKPPGGDSHTDQQQGRQSAEVLFFVLFCFVLVNFYSRIIFVSQPLSVTIKNER